MEMIRDEADFKDSRIEKDISNNKLRWRIIVWNLVFRGIETPNFLCTLLEVSDEKEFFDNMIAYGAYWEGQSTACVPELYFDNEQAARNAFEDIILPLLMVNCLQTGRC